KRSNGLACFFGSRMTRWSGLSIAPPASDRADTSVARSDVAPSERSAALAPGLTASADAPKRARAPARGPVGTAPPQAGRRSTLGGADWEPAARPMQRQSESAGRMGWYSTRMRLLLVAFALAAGCSQDDVRHQRPAPVLSPAAVAAPDAGARAALGVPACDAYLEELARCIHKMDKAAQPAARAFLED